MAEYILPGPEGKVLSEPEGLERTEDDLTPAELGYLMDYCVKYGAFDLLQMGSGLSSAVISQFAALTIVENDDEKAKKLLAAAPPGRDKYNYAMIKAPIGWAGAGATQKFALEVIGGMRKETVAEFERLQHCLSDAYEMSDVVFVVDGLGVNSLRLQIRYLAPYYNVVGIIHSGGDRYLVHWERNLLTNRKSVL